MHPGSKSVTGQGFKLSLKIVPFRLIFSVFRLSLILSKEKSEKINQILESFEKDDDIQNVFINCKSNSN